MLAENVIEDEHEFTREMGRGQLPKFGAVRENAQAEFVRWVGIKKISGETDSARLGCGFLRNKNCAKKVSGHD